MCKKILISNSSHFSTHMWRGMPCCSSGGRIGSATRVGKASGPGIWVPDGNVGDGKDRMGLGWAQGLAY